MATYTLINSVTVGAGGAATIVFSSIPATYTDLVLKVSARIDSATELSRLRVRFNGDTANNYTNRLVYQINGTVGSDSSGASSGITYFYATGANATSSTFSSSELYIPNYAGSTQKSVSVDTATENNSTNIIMGLSAGLWSGTSAITSMEISDTNTFTFVQYTTAYLYGVSNA